MKENEVLIKVEGLSKKFSKNLKSSLWYGLQDLVTAVKGNSGERELRKNEFWALQDINFEVRRGECLGLIGHNGAGKSTLLKILNGLINPDAGKVTMKGRVGALIELGAGFNPILSGRENIYNNGAVLGFFKKEIDTKVAEIIAFAEIHEFIDMPVQNYSSGMRVRLGFAVAAQMEPDILLIDEVLAVGDLGFVLKCFKTIDTILPNTAVIFVSHSMPMVSRICSKILLMEHGQSEFQGNDVGKAIDMYYIRFSNNDKNVVFTNNSVKLEKIEIVNAKGNFEGVPRLNWADDFELLFEFEIEEEVTLPKFYIMISDKEQRPVALMNPNDESLTLKREKDRLKFIVRHHNLQLSKGVYSINLTLLTKKSIEPILRINNALSFQIIHETEIWPSFLLNSSFESINDIN